MTDKIQLDNYSEPLALQSMLRAADAAVAQQCKRMDAGDYSIDKFTITIGDTCTAFMLGGPQYAALYAFAQHIANENFYSINMNSEPTTVEE